ncbi:MAG: Uma2 family endonuclease [Candidatus Tectomicrobia bacterium]|uniref:Uma2 family endonuclease n=1 Tax=Tectimicrobiota bacterium TaxID=2528274 RepID=A0A932CMK5_UNCTE|nr:Uma2 family endonuclease [Candidatus Tectomicrobia bacterium]
MNDVMTSTFTPVYPTLPADQTWPAQGQWTYEDFLRLPDEGIRYEIIDGVLYMTNAPDFQHQYAVVQMVIAIGNFVRAGSLGLVLTAPIEVHLPGISQPVQPDVLLVAQARREIVKAQFIEGAPDLIAEVLSPSTILLDRKVKFDAYERAGVREYWVANPKLHSIEVYSLISGEYALHGEYGPGERLTSPLLPSLDLLTDTVFTI